MAHAHRQRLMIGAAVFSTVVVSMLVSANQHLRLSGRRAEAQLMLTYMATLQGAHFADKNKYVAFEQFYGAPLRGEDRCKRPAGAEELGFLVENCGSDPTLVTVRYAYRVNVDQTNPEHPRFLAEALSGTDRADQSLVCLGGSNQDQWQIDATKVPQHTRDCE